MLFRYLFGVVTLQIATTILSAVFFVIGFLVLGVNVFTYEKHVQNDWPIDLVIVLFFVFLMFATGSLMFISSFIASRKLCFISMLFIVLVHVYWAVLTSVSFMNNFSDIRKVCVEDRCPESFWLANLRYRLRSNKVFVFSSDEDDIIVPKSILVSQIDRQKPLVGTYTTKTDRSTPINNHSAKILFKSSAIESPSRQTSETKRFINTKLHRMLSVRNKESETGVNKTLLPSLVPERKMKKSQNNPVSYPDYDYITEDGYDNTKSTDSPKPSKDNNASGGSYKIGKAFVGAVFFGVVNFVFFVFALVVVWSYAIELKWFNPKAQSYQTPSQILHIPK